MIARGEGAGKIKGINGDGRKLDLGGEHETQYTDDVLWSCASETRIIL